MVTCVNTCSIAPKTYVSINKTTSNIPSGFWNETISLGIDLIDYSVLLTDDVMVDLSNLVTGECLGSQHIWLQAGQTQRVIFNTTMPSIGDLKLRVSVSSLYIMSYTCQDFWDITIRGNDPNAIRYDCVDNVCAPKTGGVYPSKSAECIKACSAGAGTPVGCNSANDMNIMGICVPKPVVLGAFALVAIYIFKK